jgi:D-glycero-D-manno-heptose 1,7-bisphosphate phosphatase
VGVDEAVSARAVFLDRDGVLNAAAVRDGRPYPPATVEELRILPGVRAALDDLKRARFLLLVVTNQPDVARGTVPRSAVEAIHDALRTILPLDGIYTCWHEDVDRCACRKPAPGLLLLAAREWNIDLERSFMIGDRWRDTAAGIAAGCRTIFVDHGWSEKRPDRYDAKVSSLAEAAVWILHGGAHEDGL